MSKKFIYILFLLCSVTYGFEPILLARWTYDGSGYSPVEVWLSTDGGSNWSLRGVPDSASMDPNIGEFGIGITATPTKKLCLICFTYYGNWGARFYFSSDTGATWERRATITTSAILNFNSAGIIAVSDTEFYVYLLGSTSTSEINVYKTADGGYNWTQIATISVPSGGDDCEGEMAFTGEKFFIGEWTSTSSEPYCWASSDGINWSISGMIVDGTTSGQNMRSVGIISLHDTLYATVWSNAMTLNLYKSTDQGVNWSYVTTVFNEFGTDDGTQSI